MLHLVTGPAAEPITVAEAKAHVRVDLTNDDSLLSAFIAAAREICEEYTHRAFVTQTWDLKLDSFPARQFIELPKPPLQSVTSVTYVDPDGVTQTLTAGADYTVAAPTGPQAMPGRVNLAYGATWPTTRPIPDAVTVRFVAGYGNATDVPEGLRTAIRLAVAELYARRELSQTGMTVTSVPITLKTLLDPFYVPELA